MKSTQIVMYTYSKGHRKPEWAGSTATQGRDEQGDDGKDAAGRLPRTHWSRAKGRGAAPHPMADGNTMTG